MPRPTLEEPEPKLTRIRGRRKFYIRWTDPSTGRSKVVSTGHESESDAKAALADFKEDLLSPGENPTVNEMLVARLRDLEHRDKPTTNARTQHKPLKDLLGSLRASQVTPYKLADYREKRGKPTAVAREMEELRSALLLAAKHGWIARAPDVQKPAKRPPRHVFLTKEQAQQLMAATLSEHLWLFMAIGFTTGARRGAILDLTWDRADLKHGYIDFNNPEIEITKKRRAVTKIDRRLVVALREARKSAKSDRVIEYRGKPVAKINRGFQLAAERAKLPWATPHVMKHSVISWLAEDGYTVDQISDMTMTDAVTVKRIYRKFNPDYLADLAGSLGDAVFGKSQHRSEKLVNGC